MWRNVRLERNMFHRDVHGLLRFFHIQMVYAWNHMYFLHDLKWLEREKRLMMGCVIIENENLNHVILGHSHTTIMANCPMKLPSLVNKKLGCEQNGNQLIWSISKQLDGHGCLWTFISRPCKRGIWKGIGDLNWFTCQVCEVLPGP